ncbi:MAG: carbohydrate ABC transporter permease [Christensenellales bacterium]|jgi:multiple sugar transport system permease protein
MRKKTAIAAKKTNRWWEPYILVTPMLIMMGVLFLYPICKSVLMAFQDFKLTAMNNVRFNGLENFSTLFKDKYIMRVLGNSLLMTPILVLVSTALGLAIAFALNKDIPLRGLFQTVIFLPSAISGFISAIAFRWMANGEYGVFNDLLMNVFHLTDEKLPFLSSPSLAMFLVVLATVWLGTPSYAMTLLAAMQSVPRELEEAAEIDGCNALRRAVHITLPFIKPTFIMLFLLKFIWSFNYLDIVSTATSGGPAMSTMTLPMYMYSLGFTTWDFGRSAALGLLVLAGLAAFVSMYMRVTGYEKESESQ